MGNLFIGFPVPRAKIALMIEGAAPPLEHVENHLPDGSDPIVLPGDITADQNLTWDGAKFVGSDAPEAGGYASPISIHPSSFIPGDDTIDYVTKESGLTERTSFSAFDFFAPVILPNAVTITKLTLYAYRDDGSASLGINLFRCNDAGTKSQMALVSAGWEDGNGSGYDDTIVNPVIDNTAFSYVIELNMNPNDAILDVRLRRIQIDFT